MILYVDSHDCANCRDERAGVRRFARLAGWDCLFERAADESAIRAAVARRRSDGLIVECSLHPNAYPPRTFGKVPVVYLDCRPGARANRIIGVAHDSEATGRRAAQELMKLGMGRYAYVGYHYRAYWSFLRERGFVSEVRAAGHDVRVFRGSVKDLGIARMRSAIERWCEGIRPGTAVFAANDEIGAIVLAVCGRRGLAVPKDVVVLGVDDDETVCARTEPSLSSLKVDFERAGYLAAELMDDLMTGRSPAPVARRFCALGIVRRRSTGDSGGRSSPSMVRAVALIREQAVLGLTVREVVASTGLSPRLAEMRFRAMTGRSIQEEIMLTRFEQVFQMLRRGPVSHTVLADTCGFRSADTLRREFRRRTGMSISDWCRK